MIAKGSTVELNYRLEIDGQLIEDSASSGSITYVHGNRQLVPGLEDELTGLFPGDFKSVIVPPEKAFGAHSPDAVQSIPKDTFQQLESIQVGGMVEGRTRLGEPFKALVVDETETTFVLDFNHPLAGKTLHFEIRVVSVT